MPLSREVALDILGLPTFATVNDIVLRYKVLALMWFPENHHNPEFALQEFSNVSEAALKLIFPDKTLPRTFSLPEMYGFFQYIFFGDRTKDKDCCECASDDCSETSLIFEESVFEAELLKCLQANNNASELISEEEREKSKAEKRRAKKKRRKEKKKMEKLEKETSTEKNDSSNSKASKQKKIQETKSSESEEDLDTSSAFVSVIARKHKKVPDLEIKDKKEVRHSSRKDIPKEDHHSVVLRSRQLALRGNEMANLGYYSEAAELFSESIKLDPSDHRFYGNRSYCYDRLGLYEKALKDADKAIALSPVWPKGYFRKGRALLGLKKYALAEQFFVEVLKRDNDCDDAITELRKAKIWQIMEKGYSKEHAETAISAHGSVTEALSSLLANGISRVHIRDNTDIFISDDEGEVILKSVNKPKAPQQPYDIKTDPNNPEGHNSLWIGNVQPDVTEKKITSLFAKYGDLLSVKVMPEKFCAFVNYKLKTSPGKAMQAYQGYELSGAKLVIRFPNLPGETIAVKKKPVVATPQEKKLLGPVNGNECYFWRTTGCIHGDQCRYQHIKEHKGIDNKKK